MPFRILSLSGGGARGIFQAVFLREIYQHLGQPLRNNFDLIAGTSTGAIIALGIALDIKPSFIVDLFETKGPLIFPSRVREKSKPLLSLRHKGPIYDQTVLARHLRDVFVDRQGKQYQLKDCRPSVVITATNLDRYQIRSFTVLDRCGAPQSRDGELFVDEVALASAAAPMFFKAIRPRGRDAAESVRAEERTYVDGALWANNPALHAAMTAHTSLGIPFEDMRMVSMGNGELPGGSIGVDFNRMRRGLMVRPLLDMMFSTQSELADATVGTLLGDPSFSGHRFLRINAALDQQIDLDDSANAILKLKPLAEASARAEIGKWRQLTGA